MSNVLRPIHVLRVPFRREYNAPRRHIPVIIETSYLPTFLRSPTQNLLPFVLRFDMLMFSKGDTMQISPFLEMVYGDEKSEDVERWKVIQITCVKVGETGVWLLWDSLRQVSNDRNSYREAIHIVSLHKSNAVILSGTNHDA